MERRVRARAADRCEYCQMHQALQGATFHVEHIVPRSHGGATRLGNLAWSCPGCNLHKAGRIDFPDPETSRGVPLYNPRSDCWGDHFRWDGFEIVPLTAVGRATCEALCFNHPRRIKIRQAEAMFGLFPPGDSASGQQRADAD
jgi:hypothetical protein